MVAAPTATAIDVSIQLPPRDNACATATTHSAPTVRKPRSMCIAIRLSAVPVQNSLLFYNALLAHKVPSELHVYPHGGHGFSFAFDKGRVQDWTHLCARWMSEL